MTTETTTTTDERQNGNNQPSYLAKVRQGFGKKATYERIGVGLAERRRCDLREACRHAGRQQGFTLYTRGGQRQGGGVALAARRPIAERRAASTDGSAPRVFSWRGSIGVMSAPQISRASCLAHAFRLAARAGVFNALAAFGPSARRFFAFIGPFDRAPWRCAAAVSVQVIVKPRVSSLCDSASKGPSGMM